MAFSQDEVDKMAKALLRFKDNYRLQTFNRSHTKTNTKQEGVTYVGI